KGPEFIEAIELEPAGPGHFKTPMRPLSAVDENIDAQDPNKEKHHD
ncbi:cytochrome ubiquinol oxidase subunit I, partial [Acinetobacter proteolyticus]